jgi:drug/metabolite transporter (DMT)-like permease
MVGFKDYFQLHFIVFLWGFTAILGNLISIPSVEMLVYRVAITLVAFGVLTYYHKNSFHLEIKQIAKLIIIGWIIALHWVFFYSSAKISSVSICLAGFATTTLWASLADPIINKKKFSWFDLALGLVMLYGLYLIYKFEYQYSLGLFLGVLAALTSAIFTALNSRVTKQITSSYTLSFYEMTGVLMALVLFLPIYREYVSPSQSLQFAVSNMDIFYILVLTFGCTVYPFITSIKLLKKFSAFMMNLTVNLEPVYGILMAYFLLNEKEKMSMGFYIGAGIILVCVLAYPFLKKLFEYKKPTPIS